MSNTVRGRTIVRRRDGHKVRVTQVDEAGKHSTTDLLLQATQRTELINNIHAATLHLVQAAWNVDTGRVATTITRRDDQDNVFRKMADFLEKISLQLSQDPANTTPMGRIIQPPRTGKTVLMGEIIGASGATALILVPTLSLVDQHRQKLAQQLPTVSIGILTGEEKRPSPRGITIATYDTMMSMHQKGIVADWLRHITFVFADEGHESMTKIRQDMLRDAFDSACVRVAFTATPDYNKRRALATFYPVLISEISLAEAYRLKLLAPFKVWAQVVDVDASTVRLVQGDYDQEEMSRLMSSGPVFETCRQVRWEKEDNASRATLICCGSKQQAHDLRTYLMNNRPAGSPRPQIILDDTDPEQRRRILHDFETERIDTIINVGVLLRGWDSKICKLLIDLYLSTSLVRSKQKYFRPLTRDGDYEASIWLIVPQHLPRDPVLPSIVFGTSVHETWIGETLVSSSTRNPESSPTPMVRRRTPIKDVDAKSETVLHGVDMPTLNPSSPQEVRQVLESKLHPDDGLPTYRQISKVAFNHPLFGGWGSTLLKYCGVYSSAAFAAWIQQLYPEQAGTDLLKRARLQGDDWPCREDAQMLIDNVNAGILVGDVAWRSVFGPSDDEEAMDPLTALLCKEEWEFVVDQIDQLPNRSHHVLKRLYLDPDRHETVSALGRELGVSRPRAQGLLESAMDRLRARIQALQAPDLVQPQAQDLISQESLAKTDEGVYVRDRAWAKRFYNTFVHFQRQFYEEYREKYFKWFKGRALPDWFLLRYEHPWEESPTRAEITTHAFKERMITQLLEGYDLPEPT